MSVVLEVCLCTSGIQSLILSQDGGEHLPAWVGVVNALKRLRVGIEGLDSAAL
jgi:hypothetical protein